MEIYLTSSRVDDKYADAGSKKNVELASRHSHSILKINTTILCWLTVDNDAEEICIIY